MAWGYPTLNKIIGKGPPKHLKLKRAQRALQVAEGHQPTVGARKLASRRPANFSSLKIIVHSQQCDYLANKARLYCTVLYCTVLYCTVLYCTVLYCTVLYCNVLYCTVLYCTVLYSTVLYCTVPYSAQTVP